MSPFNEARHYLNQGIAEYEFQRCKFDAKTWLYIGNLDRAIHLTQVALFIRRIQKVS
jgi:hypothetical protein